jgi:hypothetical protein
MAIVLRPDGSFVFDTAEEAVDYSRLNSKSVNGANHGNGVSKPPVPPVSAKPGGMSAFKERLSAKQRQFLSELKTRRQLTLVEVATMLEMTNNGVAAVTAGIKKAAKGTTVDVGQLYSRSEIGSGKRRVITFSAGPMLATAAA